MCMCKQTSTVLIGPSQREEAIVRARAKYLRDLVRVFVSVVLLWSGGLARSLGQYTTNECAFQIISIRPAGDGRVVVTWAPTSTNFIFGVFSADGLFATNVSWTSRVAAWGDAEGVMSWTDAIAGVDRRMYRLVRVRPSAETDWDADGLPDTWEADYGLNPFDARDARADPDGDGADNLTEYLQDRDPTRNAVPDPGEVVDLQVFTPLE